MTLMGKNAQYQALRKRALQLDRSITRRRSNLVYFLRMISAVFSINSRSRKSQVIINRVSGFSYAPVGKFLVVSSREHRRSLVKSNSPVTKNKVLIKRNSRTTCAHYRMEIRSEREMVHNSDVYASPFPFDPRRVYSAFNSLHRDYEKL